MQHHITTRQKFGITVWSLLWLISAAALLQLYFMLTY